MKIKNIITIIVMSIMVLIFSILLFFGNKETYSKSERRKLENFPEINFENIVSGKYMTDFETASTDNFPFRDSFRRIKAYTSMIVFNQLDNNGIFTENGHISKLEYSLNYDMLDHACEKFENIYKTYFEGTEANMYFSVIPDKNMFIANECLSLDYQEFFSYMKQKTSYMNYIDISDLLSESDYYTTDSHWKQESITDIAERIALSMGAGFKNKFSLDIATNDFYGVYYGQSALKFKPDSIRYLLNDAIKNCKVTIYPNGKPVKSTVYNTEKLTDKDPYEFFLSGSQPIVNIENPLCENDKKLIVFRDSFGSSLAPLIISSYSNITLVDTRYIDPSYLTAFVDTNVDDVLFIYSTLILNSSLGIR